MCSMGCCKRTTTKKKWLESSVYELIEEVKELKGKKAPKAKAKGKTAKII